MVPRENAFLQTPFNLEILTLGEKHRKTIPVNLFKPFILEFIYERVINLRPGSSIDAFSSRPMA